MCLGFVTSNMKNVYLKIGFPSFWLLSCGTITFVKAPGLSWKLRKKSLSETRRGLNKRGRNSVFEAVYSEGWFWTRGWSPKHLCSGSVLINCVQQIASVTAKPKVRCCQSCSRKLSHLCLCSWEFWSALSFLDLYGKENNVRLGR